MATTKDNINDLLRRGVVETIDARHLELRLGRPKPLRIKLGIDATAHDLHLGHVVTLRKLRAFQRAGHRAVLIIGDFTAQIGDPSGRSSARQSLTLEQTRSYAKTYLEQAGKILDLRRTEVRYNSEWLGEFKPREFFKLLSTMTVQQVMAHETFAKRLDKGQPLGAHEIMYPLMQGYDSVAVEADVELGGADQKFNLLAGRDVQKAYHQEPQDVVMMEYLIGTDGREKMSKSVGNTINITDQPDDMFGKIMSIPDKLIPHYFELTTDTDEAVIQDIKKSLRTKTTNPRDVKIKLGQAIVEQYHGHEAAEAAAEQFQHVFRQGGNPKNMPTIELKGAKHLPLDLLVSHKLVSSRSEARRLIEQGGVRIDKKNVASWQEPLEIKNGAVLAVGKRKFYKIVITA